VISKRTLRLALLALGAIVPVATAQEPPPAQWLRLDPLPAEMAMNSRESFEGVPPRFVLLTDGSVFVGGRREVLRGFLDRTEMQAISTRLDLVRKSLGSTGAPPTLSMGESEGPATFRFSVLLGAPMQTVVMGKVPSAVTPALLPLPDFVRRLAGFRHASLKPFDPAEYTMIVREKTLPGGCRTSKGLPSLAQAMSSSETRVSETLARGFPTGPDISQVCEGSRRFTVVFRPFIPGER